MYWTTHLTGPQRVNHAAVAVGDRVYSFGGYCKFENYSIRMPMDVHILNTVTLKWHVYYPTKKGRPNWMEVAPFQRYGHTAVAYGTSIYIWGGRNDEISCNQLFCFDTESLMWAKIATEGSVPNSRDGHSACIINDYMYIFGGFEDGQNHFSQDVYCLHLKSFIWQYVKTKGITPSYRDFHSATAVGNLMFVFGGRGDENAPFHSEMEQYPNNISYLDITTCKWESPTTFGEAPLGRRSHSAFVYDGLIYIFGGYNSLIDTHFNDMWRFNPKSFRWQRVFPLGETPSERRRQCCVVVNTRMFLFGGTSPVDEEESEVPSHIVLHGSKLVDHDDLHILDFEPSLRILCLMVVLKHKLDPSFLPENIKMDLQAMTANTVIQRIPTMG